MQHINIEQIDINNAFFHFTLRSNLESIEQQGLLAKVGGASKMVQDKPRVCLSKGGKGLLGTINSFLYEFKRLRICEIPLEYRKYFSIANFDKTDIVDEDKVYDAFEKRLKEEVYLVVDAKEGEDFSREDVYGLGSAYDIKGRVNHNIDPEKIMLLETPNGNSALEVIKYIYNRLLAKNPEQRALIISMNSDLDQMLKYIRLREANLSEIDR